MNNNKIFFAGDHNAGLHPKVVEAIQATNTGKAPSYRDDAESLKLNQNFEKLLGQKVKLLMFNTGTAANVCAIASVIKLYQSVVCAKSGHINTYETGAVSRFAGCSLDLLPTVDGKIKVEQIAELLKRRPKENVYAQPKVVFISQPSEYGIVWSLEELKELADFCHQKDLYLFMDGARIANAVQKLGVSLKAITADVSLDMFTFGGIKNGGLVDTLIYLHPEIAPDVDFVFKQLGQDAAPSRFYAATVNALLKEVEVVLPVETNLIWAVVAEEKNRKLLEQFVYYLETNDLDIEKYAKESFFARWVTSWATSSEEVEALAGAINERD